MPRIDRINTGRDVTRGGSVGRQRVSAPIEAFGGGPGLSNLAGGLQAVGGNINQMEERAQRAEDIDKQQKAKLQEAAMTAQAARDKKMRELKRDRLILTYNQQANGLSNEIKQTQTAGTANTKDEIYWEQSRKLREELVSDPGLNDVEREEILIKMEKADLARAKSLMSAQASEDEQFMKDTRASQAANIINNMRNKSSELGKDNVAEWFASMNPDASEYALGLLSDGTPREAAQQEVNTQMANGFREAINEKSAAISNSLVPAGEADNIVAIINQVPKSIMDDEEKASLTKKVRSMADAQAKKLKDQVTKAQNNQLDVLADDMVNLTNDYDKEQLLADFTANNPNLQAQAITIFNARKKVMGIADEVALSEELAATKDPEAFQDSLMGRLKKGEISIGAYREYKEKAQTSMDRRKKSSWNRIIARQKDILEGRVDIGAGTGEIKGARGMFGISDIKLKQEMLDAWKNVEELAFDPNVTWRELNEVADNVFFKPEAKMLSMSMEDRMDWARTTLLERAVEPGTQTGEDAIDPYTRARSASNDEILEKLFPGLTNQGKRVVDGETVEMKDVFPSESDEADKDIIKGVADQIRSTIE